MLRGIALVRTKRYREALEALALEKTDYGVTPFWMAQAHWYLGEKDKARARYDEGARLSAGEEMKALRAKTAALLGIE